MASELSPGDRDASEPRGRRVAGGGGRLRMRAEMKLAQEVHVGLVPALAGRTERAEFVGASHPSGEVGGDLVDVFTVPDGKPMDRVRVRRVRSWRARGCRDGHGQERRSDGPDASRNTGRTVSRSQ